MINPFARSGRAAVLAVVLVASACAGTSDASSEPADAGEAPDATESNDVNEATVVADPTITTERTSEEPVTTSESANEPTNEPTTEPTPDPDESAETTIAGCVRLTEFETQAEIDAWLVVNDDVMGGRSAGGAVFADSVMTFTGTINTDGGGFASLRLPIAEGTLAGVESVRMRVRSDGRAYKLTLRDSLEGRDNRTSHQAAIPVSTPGEWEIVEVSLADLDANVFGRSVETEPFVPELANRVGLMMSDGVDGDFVLEIDWIDLCES